MTTFEFWLGTALTFCFLVALALLWERLIEWVKETRRVRRWRAQHRVIKAYQEYLGRDGKRNIWDE